MKYIRTKDGMILTDEQILKLKQPDYFDVDGNAYKLNNDNLSAVVIDFKKLFPDSIITDTIEELCDEFVDTSELEISNTGGWLYDEFDNKNKCLVYYVEDERRTISLNEFDDLSKIFGAIWCEWGLKYVAKMNDKGELELL